MAEDPYDLVVVGTGFASSFFLHGYLKRAAPGARVLVLERGPRRSHAWQLANREQMPGLAERTFTNRSQKPWLHSPIFGGGSNCWWGCTPRLMPNDFRLRSLYGVGADWPVQYDELEGFYQEAEEIMAIAGPGDGPFPRSRPYPQPPHHLSDPDRILQTAYAGRFFAMPSARTRSPTTHRPPCCATGVCNLCPVDAKFTVLNELGHLYADPRVTVLLDATVEQVEHAAGLASAVEFRQEGSTKRARGERIVLGANALFNPHILLRSGLAHPSLGAGLHEQASLSVTVDLGGVDNFQGSTSLTGHGYMLYDGPHRAQHAACLMETSNQPKLRMERARWRQRLEIKFLFEDLPSKANRVTAEDPHPDRPTVRWERHSEYTQRGMTALEASLENLLAPLPVERIVSRVAHPTEGHILGTTVMGNDPRQSIVDRNLIHHRLRNLLVLGGSTFPTSSPANPTLTIAALSLWAASRA